MLVLHVYRSSSQQTKYVRIALPSPIPVGQAGITVDHVQKGVDQDKQCVVLVDRQATNGHVSYNYVKLVGETVDEELVDIYDWAVGTKDRRIKEKTHPITPEREARALEITRPAGMCACMRVFV
jgi:predicted metal-dependent RNase